VPGGPAPAPDPTVVLDEADNCAAVPVVAFVSDVSDNGNCPETITRTYSVTDNCGNQITVTQTILITDPILPTATAPAPVSVECISQVPAADPTIITDEADNNGVPTVTFVNDVSNGQSCPTIITRTYRVTDPCGNSIDLTQTITVDDITAPTGTAPGAVTVQCTSQVPAANTALVTGVSDNCSTAPVVAFVGDVSNGATCPEVITRTYSITDNCGNVTTVTQTITVDDTTPPVATAPAAVIVQCISQVPASNPGSVTGVSDNCTAAPVVAFVSDVSNGATCPEVITRTYSVTDNCGNVTTVTQTITVDDTTPPTASNPATITVPSAAAVPAPNTSAVADEADNCTVVPTVTWVSDVSDGNVCNNETITRTFLIADNCGNTKTVTQLIVISATYPDINAGPDQTICEGATATLTPSNPDNATISWSPAIQSGQPFTPSVGSTVYTVTADNYGCISTDQVTILVNPAPVVSFTADINQGCLPLTVTFTNTSTASTSLSNCLWDMGNGITQTGCGTIVYTYNTPGLFDVSLTTTDANGCTTMLENTDLIYVEGYPNAQFSASSYELNNLEEVTEVNFSNSSTGAVDYFWEFGDGSSSILSDPSHIFETMDYGSYEVMLVAYSSLGCTDTAYHLITVSEELIYYIPNTFTPDGDEFNNTFQPVFTSGFDPYNFNLYIFNRWGELIFESHDASIGWDGTYGGVLCQDGTYTWKIDFKSRINDKRYMKAGHVNLIR
jgi:gliding motility-associated-like protein